MANENTNVPAERTDNVGKLTRLLMGDENTPPDLTAAPLLYDALMEEGDAEMARTLRREVGFLLPLLWTNARNQRDRRQQVAQVQQALQNALFPLMFDFVSQCGCLAAMLDAAAKPDEVRPGQTKLETVRILVEEHVRKGMRVPLDNDRYGMVVSQRDADGFADVLLIEEELGYGEDGGGPMTASMGGPGMMRPLGRLKSRRFPG